MSKVRVELVERHRFRKASDTRWADAMLGASVATLGGETTYFHGETETGSSLRVRRDSDDASSWKADLASQWATIARFSLSLSSAHGRISLDCHADRGELSLRIESATEDQARTIATAVTPALEPIVSRSVGPSLEGARKRFYAKEHLSLDWFRTAADAARAQIDPLDYFEGRFSLKGSPGTEWSKRDFQSWKSALLGQWEAVTSFYCWMTGPQRTLMFTCDTRREIFDIEARSLSDKESDEMSRALSVSLALEPIVGDPYRYRKFARFFKVRDWKSGHHFAQAIEKAVATAFDRDPVPVDLYVEVGEHSVDLLPFTDVAAFTAGVDKWAGDIARAKLYLEGPRGIALGIYLDRLQKRLEIRSSLERHAFDAVCGVFEDGMHLKFLEEKHDQEAAADPREPLWKKVLIPSGVALLTAAGSLLSWDAIKEAKTRSTVEIVRPWRSADGKPTPMLGQNVRVDWVIKKAQWWDTSEDESSQARVRVFDASGKEVLEQQDAQPGTTIPLGPGIYEIEVTAGSLQKRDRVMVQVP